MDSGHLRFGRDPGFMRIARMYPGYMTTPWDNVYKRDPGFLRIARGVRWSAFKDKPELDMSKIVQNHLEKTLQSLM